MEVRQCLAIGGGLRLGKYFSCHILLSLSSFLCLIFCSFLRADTTLKKRIGFCLEDLALQFRLLDSGLVMVQRASVFSRVLPGAGIVSSRSRSSYKLCSHPRLRAAPTQSKEAGSKFARSSFMQNTETFSCLSFVCRIRFCCFSSLPLS